MTRSLPLLLLAACGGSSSSTPAPAELHVYIWTNYHSDEAIKRFEAQNQAKVVIDTYDNNEVIEQKLQSGSAPYDVIVPSDYMVTSLARQGLIHALDEARLPGLSHLDPKLDWEKAATGARHGVPYLWGTAGYAYRAEKLPTPPDSWAPLFDAAYTGRIVLLDDMREAFAIPLKMAGHSINTTDEAALTAARDRLVAQKAHVLAYDSSDFAGKIQSGDAWIAHGYSGELARVARESGGAIRYVLPAEGATMAVDNLAIPTAARNVDLAYKFIEFMLDPAIAAETTNATGYATANLDALPMVKPELAKDPAVFPPAEVLQKCEIIQDLGEKTARLDELWTEVKAN